MATIMHLVMVRISEKTQQFANIVDGAKLKEFLLNESVYNKEGTWGAQYANHLWKWEHLRERII